MIQSILDSDLYKFSMQAAVLWLYPDAEVTYEFVNRRPEQRFNRRAYEAVLEAIGRMADLLVTDEEIAFLRLTCPYLPSWYFVWLRAYRFDPSEVKVTWDEATGELRIWAAGLWVRTILWEVPLLAIVSECYFKHVDTAWSMEGQEDNLREKAILLWEACGKVSDFSTRRRRNFEVQDMVVRILCGFSNFVGTSNPYLAMKHPKLTIASGTSPDRLHKPKGTMAHEWIMAHQHLGSIRHCNRDAMAAWQQVYRGQLGTALTDTLGSELFFKDIDGLTARSFDGLRHDSGPFQKFVDQSIEFYRKHSIDPKSKTIIFSDGLNVENAVEIAGYCRGKIGFAFGIGTFFSNDFKGSKALNIVMKMRTIDGVNVVKFSDAPGKAIGDRDALRVSRWIVDGTALDEAI